MDNKRLLLYIIAIVAIVAIAPFVVAPILLRWPPHSGPAPIGTVNGPNVISSNAFGGTNVNVMSIMCAGKVSLTQGTASVNDSCFTGDTNIVICSDVSSANAVRCEPRKGSLALEGHANDTVAYARVK